MRVEYLGRSGADMTERVVEPYLLRGVGSDWYLESYDRTAAGERTFRVDRIRAAEPLPETFEPRDGLEVQAEQRAPRGRSGTASVWFAPEVAARETEALPSSSPLIDGAALATISYGSERWLATEILKHRGNAVLIGPEHLRAVVATRATELRQLATERLDTPAR